MKPIFVFRIFLLSFLIISGPVFSQQQNTTPTVVDYIRCNFNAGGVNTNEFEFVQLSSLPTGANNSHLWWSGDNDFTFVPTPMHIHPKSSNGNQYSAKMTDIVTENYGNGGPPPLTYTFLTWGDSKSPRTVLNPGEGIYMQTYRNAVINDTMYLIVTYKNNTIRTMGGVLNFNVGNYGRVVDAMFLPSSHPHFLPNGEQWDATTNKCTFQSLKPDEERSILIPVQILPNEEDSLFMEVEYFLGDRSGKDFVRGQNYFSLSPRVAHSHDPNLMLESSDAKNQCDYRNGTIHYTVKFQNVGDAATRYVRVETTLDNKVDMNQISGIKLPAFFNRVYDSTSNIVGSHDLGRGAIVYIDKPNRKIIFEMHDLGLLGTGQSTVTDLERTRSQVEFDIKVKSNYIFGPGTVASSLVFFDKHDPIATNEVVTVCGDRLPIGQGGGFQKIKVPFWSKWKWYIISGVSLVVGLIVVRIFRRKK